MRTRKGKVGGGGGEEGKYKMLLFASHYSTSTRVGKWVVGSGMQGEVLVGERPDTNKQTNETQRGRGRGIK